MNLVLITLESLHIAMGKMVKPSAVGEDAQQRHSQ